MNKKNIIIYVSSRNNYDMLKHEVFKNIKFEGFEFINIDDNSKKEEKIKGQLICKEKGVKFLENKSRGVQSATQTLIDFINSNRPDCKWIICFQHDNYPLTKNFFHQISEYISKGKLNEFGLIGFNNLDHGSYTLLSYYKYLLGFKPLGMIGLVHFQKIIYPGSMWLCPRRRYQILRNKLWKKPFIVELPMWASIGINVEMWNRIIKPTDKFHFHLWLPDIAMQFNSKNTPCLIIPDLYTFNNQYLKLKYGIPWNSATSAKEGNSYHFGKMFDNHWIERWGWDPLNAHETIKINNYNGTLIEKFYHHRLEEGPLKNIIL
tara:strand:+ start:16296 stop:17252 length:957 start_codon:yes stop_codon:yes gene_type:complete